MNNQKSTLNLSNAKMGEVMKKTKQVLAIAPVILILFSFVQSAGAQEWKILSGESGPGIGSVKTFIQSTLGAQEEPSDLKSTELPRKTPHYLTDREVVRLNNDRNREYAREGSWAPLETKPGEENFHLLTF